MDRTATQTIEGFNYQHNKSILEVLNASPGTKITLEGCIEDIDVIREDNITAIQCKYFESTQNVTPSILAKPIFDMIISHMKYENVNFKLYIHYNGVTEENNIEFTVDVLNDILSTKNKEYVKKYFHQIFELPEEIEKLCKKSKLTNDDIVEITNYINVNGDSLLKFSKDSFIEKTQVIAAPKMELLVETIKQKIRNDGYTEEEVENIIYPNFFQKVAELSANDDEQQRTIDCNLFKNEVYSIKELLYTKWLSKLCDLKKYKEEIKKSLRVRLQSNYSFRVIIVNISRYRVSEIAFFIKEYLKNYCSKKKLNYFPMFIIETDNEDNYLELQSLLFSAYKIEFENGEAGRKFYIDKLFGCSENKLKICMRNNDIDSYLTTNVPRRPDDLITIGDVDIENYDDSGINTINVNKLSSKDLMDVFYLGG